jgi:hypothetical protein
MQAYFSQELFYDGLIESSLPANFCCNNIKRWEGP